MSDHDGETVNRRQFIQTATTVGVAMGVPIISYAQGSGSSLQISNIIQAPDESGQWPAWRQQLSQWRTQTRSTEVRRHPLCSQGVFVGHHGLCLLLCHAVRPDPV